MKRLCTICARGGSKGLPGKNVRPLAGMPLIAYSIQQAMDSGLFEVIAVSSDSDELLSVAREAGADVLIERPAELASDTAGKIPAIHHALLEVERQRRTRYDVLVDLDATSPLRVPADIRGAAHMLESGAAESVITGSEAHRSPYFNLVEKRADGTVGLSKPINPPILRRQDAPACFDMNASIYVWRRDVFVADPQVFYASTQLFEMPAERSRDIDCELDFEIVEFLIQRDLN